MPLADYFARNALALSQALSSYDDSVVRERLEGSVVGVAFGNSADKREGRAALDMSIRLLARLYPRLAIRSGASSRGAGAEAAELAREINPSIELSEEDPMWQISIGDDAPTTKGVSFHVGSHGWRALFSPTLEQPIGDSNNPLGAGFASCLAAANLFRAVFRSGELWNADPALDFDVAVLAGATAARFDWPHDAVVEAVLVGLGAVGNAAAWAFERLDLRGSIHLVDAEQLEIGNLQRYVLARRADEGKRKVDLPGARTADLRFVPSFGTWADYADAGGRMERVLVAVDSGRDRRRIQASLPAWLANAWTQQGDLGLSTHPQFGVGACLYCLYLPTGAIPNEDEVVVQALKIPERLMQVRELLFRDGVAPRELVDLVVSRFGLPPQAGEMFDGRRLRELYVDGVCGGGLVQLGGGPTAPNLHVPLAHQSALAGILLASSLVVQLANANVPGTRITQLDVMKPLAPELTRNAQPDPRGICICQDPDYRSAYVGKWPAHNATTELAGPLVPIVR